MVGWIIVGALVAPIIVPALVGLRAWRKEKAIQNNSESEAIVLDAEVVDSSLELPYRTNAFTDTAIVPILPKIVKPKKLKRIKWAWSSYSKTFVCPKCLGNNTPNISVSHPEYCECDGTDHFHFQCSSCKFSALMETADKK